jgi:hypothetical protein
MCCVHVLVSILVNVRMRIQYEMDHCEDEVTAALYLTCYALLLL